MQSSVSKYGVLSNGEVIHEYTLYSRSGVYARILDYGGIITGYHVKDKHDQIRNIVLELSDLEQYEADRFYFGAIIGRYANRIAAGRLIVDDKEYKLTVNNNGNHLHGGAVGFHKMKWRADLKGSSLHLTYVSSDGEEGYPGELTTQVSYELNDEGELMILTKAHTSKPTHINITFHSYFNLDGQPSILDHLLSVNAQSFLLVNENQIPTGVIQSVKNTALDFSKLTLIKDRISEDDFEITKGIDHTFILPESKIVQKAATLKAVSSGIQLEVLTSEPGVQVYSGNFLDSVNGKTSIYNQRAGICMEPQHFPDSPNQPNFPSTYLKPGDVFESKTIYKVKLNL